MKLKFQGPFQCSGKGLSNVLILSYVFIKFAKAKYFYYSRLNIIDICQAVNSYNCFLEFYVYGICQLFNFVIFCDFFPRYK